jgi:hypothetical protein
MPSAPVKIFAPAPAGLEALVISGVATSGVNGRLAYAGLKGGYPAWSSDGSQVAGAANAIAEYTGTQWKLSLGSAYSALKTSAAATPVALTSWTVGTGSGSPTVAAATVAEAAEVFVPASAGGEPDAPAEVFVPETSSGDGIPSQLTITGVTSPIESDPLVLSRVADSAGYAAWEAGGFGGWRMANVSGDWILSSSFGLVYSATKTSAASTPVGLTGWTVAAGAGQPGVAGNGSSSISAPPSIFTPG